MNTIKDIFPAVALAAVLLALFWPLNMKSAADGKCKDPIAGCKNPQYIGSDDKCSCFACANGTVVCTSVTGDRLELFEAEAARRKPSVDLGKFSPEVRSRLFALGVVRDERWENRQMYANTNTYNGNMNGTNANMNAGNWNFNRNSNAQVNNMNRPPARDDK